MSKYNFDSLYKDLHEVNPNCYSISPKEERKWIDDFLSDVRFARGELENLYNAKKSDRDAYNYDSDNFVWLDAELNKLENVICAAEDYFDALKAYRDEI